MTFSSRGLYASSSKVPRGRRRPRIGWLLLGALVAVVALVSGALVALADVSVDRTEKTESFTGVTELVVQNDAAGSIRLTGTDGDAVTVERTLRGSPIADPEDALVQNDGELWAEARCDAPPFFLFSYCEVDFVIGVPEGTDVTVWGRSGGIDVRSVTGDLKLTTSSGDITATRVTGDIEADATSGDIRLDGVRGVIDLTSTSGDIAASGAGDGARAVSTSGGIDLGGFTASTVEANATSGDVKVGGGFETADVGATSGSVAVTTDAPFRRLTAESTSGDVTVRVPDGTYDVIAETGSGDREVGVATSKDADAGIEARTTSGSVRIEPGR
ncbi:hypothetical protein HNR23_003697 [Nocardiopsis mwathae]|uniref:DUF4097 domain-containing protein n=1 Tax=Nocardiopsis mwathae TaxID=1472723 RepID=A0A7W9YK34_9ACTN|nr:DUF4097 family beta strand repeat-containing protein [Nocardiopsis mwathae]MBB6173637.1 hypothetical protein [Nocardiopsis mwathae]